MCRESFLKYQGFPPYFYFRKKITRCTINTTTLSLVFSIDKRRRYSFNLIIWYEIRLVYLWVLWLWLSGICVSANWKVSFTQLQLGSSLYSPRHQSWTKSYIITLKNMSYDSYDSGVTVSNSPMRKWDYNIRRFSIIEVLF